MKQNKYNDHDFFEKYSKMSRSIHGLNAAGEWYALREMIPDLKDKRVLDLGCGYGWHCRFAREQHAQSVVGIDISEKMLERAREMTDDDAIAYRQLAIEDINFSAGEFDVVISSLALHYVEDFQQICEKVNHCLVTGGTFVLSVEHPIFTAVAAQDWIYGPQGERLHWPVDHYQEEGFRATRFLENDVVKYHRTTASLMNALINSGFNISKLAESQPSEETVAKYPQMRDESRRPMFLLISAIKKEG